MATFQYTGKHDDGRVVSGSVMGTTVEDAIADLALQGVLVTKIGPAASDPIPSNFTANKGRPVETRAPRSAPAHSNPYSAPAPPQGNPYDQPRPILQEPLPAPPAGLSDQRSYFATSVAGPLVGTVPLADLQIFFRQFASMQGAGVPLAKSFGTLSKQARVPKLSMILLEMEKGADRGQPMSATMQRYPEVFTPMMVSLIRSGEEGGFLHGALTMTSDYIVTEIEIRNLWRKATLYPKIIIAVSILIVLLTNAIIASLGKTGGLSSPLTTSSVVVIVVPLMIFSFLYFKVGLANPRIKYNWDAFTLKIPYLGGTLQQFAMAKFGRAFGALHQGGVSMGKALKLAADSCGNEYIRSKIYPAAERLDEGDGIAGTLAETGVMSSVVLDMLQTGEMSGNIDSMLNRAAEHYESEAKMRSNQLAMSTGVLFLLVTGVYVGYIVISFFAGHFGALERAIPQDEGLLFSLVGN